MQKYFKFLSPVVLLTFIILIFIFKTVPVGKLWNDYSVLFIPKDTSEKIVEETLSSCGINEAISLSNQFLPINLSENSIEFTMFKLNATKNDYHNKRINYFFDESQNFRLYYIPAAYSKQLQDAVHILSQNKINCGVDSKQTISFWLFIFFIIAAVILSIFSKNKIIFIGSALLQLFFIWCNPFFAVSIACIICLLPLFFVSNVWRRKNFLSVIVNNIWSIIIFFASVLCCFSVSLKTGFLFLADIICIVTFLYFFYSIEDLFIQKKLFIPVFIKSAKQVNLFAKKTRIVMYTLLAGTFLSIAFFFISSTNQIQTNKTNSTLSLPSNVNNTITVKSENLPELEDYYKWIWNIKTAPYKSLNKDNADNYVEFSHFAEENGRIIESKTIYSYNQTFKDNVFDEIDKLNFNSIEKVLKSEGKDFSSGYVSNGSTNTNLFCMIMMIFCFIVLLFIYFSIMIVKLRKIKK